VRACQFCLVVILCQLGVQQDMHNRPEGGVSTLKLFRVGCWFNISIKTLQQHLVVVLWVP
jgi:hypothetical protein